MGADGADLNRRLQSGKDRRSAIELRPHGDMFATRAVPRQSDCAERVNLNEVEQFRVNVVVPDVIKTPMHPVATLDARGGCARAAQCAKSLA